METAKIKELVSRMTLEEKASLCSGLDFWHTKGVERLGIPSEMVSDGPHGLRKQDDKADHLGINDSIQAVCFPAGCATASSFNRELVTKLGETLGEECQAENVSTILGPAMNIKRSPLCGRILNTIQRTRLCQRKWQVRLSTASRANISEQVRSILWQITRNITA